MALPYDYPTAVQNVTAFVQYAADVTSVGQFSILGNGFLAVLFFVMYISMSNAETQESIPVAAFVTAIVSYLFVILGVASVYASIVFTAVFVFSFVQQFVTGD